MNKKSAIYMGVIGATIFLGGIVTGRYISNSDLRNEINSLATERKVHEEQSKVYEQEISRLMGIMVDSRPRQIYGDYGNYPSYTDLVDTVDISNKLEIVPNFD